MQHPFIKNNSVITQFIYAFHKGTDERHSVLLMTVGLENDCLHRVRDKLRVVALERFDGGVFVQDTHGLIYFIAANIASPLLDFIETADAAGFLVAIREDKIPSFQRLKSLIIPRLDVEEFESVEERFQKATYLNVPLPADFFDTPILLAQTHAAMDLLPNVSDLMGRVSTYLRNNEATYGALADEIGDWMTHIDAKEKVLKVPLSLSCRRAIALADKVGADESRSIVYMGAGRRMMTHRREHQLRLGELDDELQGKLWEWLKYADLGFAELDFSTEKATLIAVYSSAMSGMIEQIPAAHWLAHFVSEAQEQHHGR